MWGVHYDPEHGCWRIARTASRGGNANRRVVERILWLAFATKAAAEHHLSWRGAW